LEQALIDKEVLIKEIHHRVKNNLQIISSMLSLQISKIDDDKTATILRDARQRISAIALTHQMLYQKENLRNIQLGDYIEKLVRQVEFLMPSTNIELVTTIQTDGSRMTIDNAVPLGLLVNELLTNA
jgi:two-component sensor histidine kinase